MEESALILERLKSIDKTLIEHNETMKKLSDTLVIIAVQGEQIQNLKSEQNIQWRKIDNLESGLSVIQMHQAQCPRLRVDRNEIDIKAIKDFQAHCPRGSVAKIWAVITTLFLAMAAAFAGHIFGEKS